MKVSAVGGIVAGWAMTEHLRITYTALAGMTPPGKGRVIRLDGLCQDGRLFRVTNEPELDDEGAFTVELEPTY